MKKDSLGNRMKEYEHATEVHLLKRCPVVIRLDMSAGHTFTKHMENPFDKIFSDCMISAMFDLTSKIQGFKFSYTQSDEASIFITDYDKIETEGWFGYDRDKIISVSDSIFTNAFNKLFIRLMISKALEKDVNTNIGSLINKFNFGVFDCRAFNVPKDDVANYFLWRCKDWHRNSLQMYARSFFSHKELHKKNSKDIHEMLHGIEKNWTKDVSKRFKNGTFINKDVDGNMIISHDATTHDAIYNIIKDYV